MNRQLFTLQLCVSKNWPVPYLRSGSGGAQGNEEEETGRVAARAESGSPAFQESNTLFHGSYQLPEECGEEGDSGVNRHRLTLTLSFFWGKADCCVQAG